MTALLLSPPFSFPSPLSFKDLACLPSYLLDLPPHLAALENKVSSVLLYPSLAPPASSGVGPAPFLEGG